LRRSVHRGHRSAEIAEDNVGEKFIDDLYNELTHKKERQLTEAEKQADSRERASVARREWRDAFVERIGQLIGAWNEKDASGRTTINFEKQENGHVRIVHNRAELELWLENDAIVGTRRRDTEHWGRMKIIDLPHQPDGRLSPPADPHTAAQNVMRPVFEKAFDG
jgi:hypothetical protein